MTGLRPMPSPEPIATEISMSRIKELRLPSAVLAIDSHPDSRTLYAACFDGGVYSVSIDSGAFKLLCKHDSYASGVQYLPQTGVLISAGYDGALRWTRTDSGEAIRTVQAHRFWSWRMRVSPNLKLVGSVTGQYAAGGYKYEPARESEPSVRVLDAESGKQEWSLPHTPPVLSVAFSADSRYIAAANMMGEIRIWDLQSGKQAAAWTTPDFTCWGIIKSHHYIGGIFDMCFATGNNDLLVCGMGPMVDPMAGNGKQTWQRFAWREATPRKTEEIFDSDAGHGLMEVITHHPNKPLFLMSGRLAQGKWNTALFDAAGGRMITSLDCGMRVTGAVWLNNGAQVALCGAVSQERKRNGKCPDFGRIKIYGVSG